jgi:hypothetical protein
MSATAVNNNADSVIVIRTTLLWSLILLLVSATAGGQTKSPKRGICGDASPADLAILAPYTTWYYDWGVEPPAVSQGQLSGIEWVPMAWNAPSNLTDFENRIPAGSLYLLGFNEPNFLSQANMTPAQAAAAWPGLEAIAARKGLKLVSPAVNWCGDCVDGVTNDPVDWLDKFFAACPGCKVDYIAVHSYAPGSESLRNYLTKFKKYNKPLWVTEFAPWDPPKPDFEGVVRYMKEAIPILENDPDVFRYSWFATRVGINPDISLLGSDGVLTKLGQLYTSMGFPGLSADLPPVVMAGPDGFISQPASSVTLNGSVYDANNDAAVISWTQESGPATAAFNNASVEGPVVSGLVPGIYIFRMTATAGGRSDFDEVSVTVTTPNIALGKPVSASSVQGPATPSTAVNDGSLTTRWSSAYTDVEWIRIDLQAVYDLTGARIFWEAAAAKNFKIQVSTDDASWTTVYTTINGDGGTDGFAFASAARYIRMYAGDRLTEYGYSIYEFEVFGTLQTGIRGVSVTQSFNVYPNPVNGGPVRIVSAGRWTGREASVTLSRLSGETVHSEPVPVSGDGTVDYILSPGEELPPGVYLLTLGDGKRSETARLVIR